MTKQTSFPIAVALLCAWAAGCTRRAPPRPLPPQTRPDVDSTQETLREAPVLVVYHRTGGIAGTDDRIVLWSDGLVQVAGRMMRTTVANVPPDQVAQVRSLLKGWEGLESPPPLNAADAFVVEIFHNGKTIVVSDGSPPVPGAFTEVRKILESIGR